MFKSDIQPQTLPEAIAWYYITGTYIIYLLGAQFFGAILFALFLVGYAFWKWFNEPQSETFLPSFSWSALVWLISMLTVGLALVLGHLDFGHGVVSIAKSSLKWIPFALFPIAGYLIPIRKQLVFRAVSILCAQSLCLIPFLSLAALLKLPHELYISPLSVLGGEVSRYAVNLYVTDLQESRLVLFAPHCPALGLVGGVLFCLTLQDSHAKWRWLGIAGSLGMVLFSVSRAAILSIPMVLLVYAVLRYFAKPWFHLLLALSSLILGITLPQILTWLEDFQAQFYAFRAGSSRTRAVLEQLALDQWAEAPLWGRGQISATGPLITGEKAIGTHHTWLGMLYTQGFVGFSALALAFSWSFLSILFKTQIAESIRYASLGIILMLFMFTFADIIYDYSYIYWPGLLVIGQAFRSTTESSAQSN